MKCINPLIKINSKKMRYDYYNNSFVSYKWFKNKKDINKLLSTNKIELYPCGNCYNCISQKRFHWVQKLKLERDQWKYVYFVTLTYNNNNLPLELKVSHLQNFIKYLRRLTPEPIRYFGTGEYGSNTKRPHYHLILFTNYEYDLNYLKSTKNGNLYDCYLFNKAWKNQGYVWVAHDISDKSFGYTSSYSCKSMTKQYINVYNKVIKNNIEFIKNDNKINGFDKHLLIDTLIQTIQFKKPEFIIMSKKPPLGSMNKNYTNAPSNLLKWHLKEFYNSMFNMSYIKWNLLLILDTRFKDILDYRKNQFFLYLKNNDLYNLIETNRALKNKEQKNKNTL